MADRAVHKNPVQVENNAQRLAPEGRPGERTSLRMIVERYKRLVTPFLFAIALATLITALVRPWFDHESLSNKPTVLQMIAHLFLLHDVLGFQALSAGVWYVAIDFQLFALLATLLWLSARVSTFFGAAQATGISAVLLLSMASLFWFNRDQDYDIWAVYFFVAYGLGAVTYWAEKRIGQPSVSVKLALRLLWLALLLALLIDFRWRLLVALATALALHITARHALPLRWSLPRWIHVLAHLSYALFLVHFPIYMLVSALFVKYGLITGPWTASIGLVLTWVLSISAAFVLHHWVEMPASRLRIGRAAVPARA